MAITLKSLAEELGMTAPTVSRALRDSPRVSAKTRRCVQALAVKRGYVANHVASGLKTNRSLTLGVLVPRINESYWAEILEGIERRACNEQYAVLIGNTRSEDACIAMNVQNMLQRRVDGIIRISHRKDYPDEVLAQLRGRNLPLIDVDIDAPDSVASNVNLAFENAEGVRTAVQYLHKLGHRHIAYLAGPTRQSAIARQRLKGFREGMWQRKLDINKNWVLDGGFEFEPSLKAAENLLSRSIRPTAVIACSDDAACAVCRVAQDLGIDVPEDLSVIGFGNEKSARLLPKPLTTIDVPAIDAGEMAFDRFLEYRDTPEKTGMSIALPVRLVVRESCAPAFHKKEHTWKR